MNCIRWYCPVAPATDISQTGGTGDAGDRYVGLDRFDRVVDQNWYKPSTSSSVEDVQYGYDAAGNVLWRNDPVNTAFGELYTYDGLNQLASFQRGTLNGTKTGLTGSATASQSWTPDALGNFTSVTTNGTAQTRTANQQNEVTTVSGATTPVYSPAGEMTTDETGKQYVYDAWGRIVTVKGSGGTTLETLTYDGLNRQVTSTSSGTTTTYYSDKGQVVEEWQGGAVQARNVWSPVYANALVVRDQSSLHNGTLDQRLYAAQDANWNVTALVNASGSVVERYAYLPYGAVTALNPSTWGVLSVSTYGAVYLFQGMRQDGASGLYEAPNRWYSTTLGRWVTTDPLGFDGRDVNLLRFVGNSPTDRVDPNGLSWLSDAWDAVNLPGAIYDYAVAKYNNIGVEKPINRPSRDITDAQSRDQLPAAGTNGQGSVGDSRRNVADSVKGAGVFVATITAAAVVDQLAGRGFDKVGDAGTAIVKWLGKDARMIKNAAGDTIIQSADGLREIRFDFAHPAPHVNPHTHIIEYKVVRGRKVEVVNKRIYPDGVDPK